MPTTYNKVTAGNQTLIDLSQDTVTSSDHIMAGFVGHLANGQQVTGTGSGGGLNIVEVTGATPSITASADTLYECGTVSTLSFTPCATGICAVLFTSGTTATVLTVPNTVKFPDWFNPASLNASTTYEINVLDGVYGVVAKWI